MNDETPPSERPARAAGEPFGDFLQRLEAWERSPDGHAFAAWANAKIVRENQAERQRQQRDLIRCADIPNRYVRQFHDTRPPTSPALEALASVESLVAVGGDPGCGKTTAACWWLMEYIVQQTTPRREPKFITAGELARSSKFDQQRIGGLLKAPRLVIDDLGMEYFDEKGAFRSLLDELVNGRYSADLPLVLTTNLSGDEFKERYGDRITDRIRETGGFIELATPSMRARSA